MKLELLYYLNNNILEVNWSYKFNQDYLIIFGEYTKYEVSSFNTIYKINIKYNYNTLETKLIIDKHFKNNSVINLTNVYFPKLTNLKELSYKIKKHTVWGSDCFSFDAYQTYKSWV